ncbi:MAG TPA: hypothetical protein VLN26_00670 [Gaiellaceae bacterium]|nr:hypothetical protein [Gaiellaceae bacterium]
MMRKLLVAAAVAAALAVPASASASSSATCWKQLLVDSYDFRIDHTYPAGCYVLAMKHIPRDLADYSDLWDVLNRALATVTRTHHKTRTIAAIPVPPTAKLPKSAQPRAAKAPLTRVAARVDPGGPQTVPLPLIVLGGLGLLLAAAGAAGAIVRRRRGGNG